MGIVRIIPYLQSQDFAATKDFYVGMLGLEVAMEEPDGDFLGLASAENRSAQIVMAAQDIERPQPQLGIDVGDSGVVQAAHDEAVRRGLDVVYPLTYEPWSVRRFFAVDPSGAVVSILAHTG